MVKVTIELSESDAEFLSRWASVSRTTTVGIEACHVAWQFATNPFEEDRYAIAEEELEALRPVLDRLHQTVRNQLWSRKSGVAS